MIVYAASDYNPTLGCNGTSEISTALGCIPVNPAQLAVWFLQKLLPIIGGIAFLLMIYGFILISTSEGDPKKIQAAKETVTSAITGLLFAVLGIFLMRLISVDILHIPGLTK